MLYAACTICFLNQAGTVKSCDGSFFESKGVIALDPTLQIMTNHHMILTNLTKYDKMFIITIKNIA